MDFLEILVVLLCHKPHAVNTKFICLLWSLSFVKATQVFPGASSSGSLILKSNLGTITSQSTCVTEKDPIPLNQNVWERHLQICILSSTIHYSDTDGPRRTCQSQMSIYSKFQDHLSMRGGKNSSVLVIL